MVCCISWLGYASRMVIGAGTWCSFSFVSLAGVVINEMHYDPEPKTEHVEFIELHNTAAEAVSLAGWSFTDGVSYTFRSDAEIAGGGYFVLTENAAHFDHKFGSILAGGRLADAQWEEGVLSNDGERVVLQDAGGEIVDEVTYRAEFPWPVAANGEGASMELIHPGLDNDLGGSWRSSTAPTPGRINSIYSENAPPQIRQVAHSPKMPTTQQETVITAKITDPDGVARVELLVQVVEPGKYVPAYLAKSTSELLGNPNTPREANPEFENPENWEAVEMADDGQGADAEAGDGIYSALLPTRGNRYLVRYRIRAEDALGAELRVPHADDPSLNFAYFSYDGVPEYEAATRTVQPEGVPATHSREVMTSLPVYFLLSDAADFAQCIAYNVADQIPGGNYDARSAFNWSGSFVYDGMVYDNISYRLRQKNDRYGGNGKRSMRFRFNRGRHIQLHDEFGNAYPEKWRTLNTSKMRARGGENFGMYEAMNHVLWDLVGVPAPETHWHHFRVVKTKDEVPQPSIFGAPRNAQYLGDFFGMYLAIEDYDGNFLDARDLADGNLYKLKSSVLDGRQVERNQGKYSVDDASDYSNILQNLRPQRDVEWLNTYVNYEHYNRYHTVVEAVRHYDVQPNLTEHLKNRAFYFPLEDREANPLGRLHTLPWDSDTSWGPNWNAGIDFAHQALFSGVGRESMITEYKNTVRAFRDLVWQEDQINPVLDRLAAVIADFVPADRDRWNGAPAEAGSETIGPLESKVEDMKRFAWVGGSWTGGNDPVGESRDSGISGREGRDAYLDWLARDGIVPNRPVISYVGAEGFPVDGLRFQTSKFSTSVFGGAPFAAMEWRLAEVSDPELPDDDPAEGFHWEWTAAWQSGELGEFVEEIEAPAAEVRAGRTYRARVRMKDNLGKWSAWSEPLEFTTGFPEGFAELLRSLVISEIMYHPAEPSAAEEALGYAGRDFEYIELFNAGEQPLDLTGLRFTKGIDFDFASGSGGLLAAGASVLVVSNVEAFVMRYGASLPVVGQYSGQLDNGGERIKLSFGGGTPVHEFEYRDRAPWPEEADGLGSSLEWIGYMGGVDPGDPAGWRASPVGGTPGVAGPESQPGMTDRDGDGFSDAAEALAGTDPEDAASVLRLHSIEREGEAWRLAWTSVTGILYRIEYVHDLASGDWVPAAELIGSGPQAEWTDDDPVRLGAARGHYRIRALGPAE